MNNKQSFSRWLAVGLLWLLGIGILGAVILRTAFGLPWSSVSQVIAVLVMIQLGCYIAMYWVRQRFRQTHDLRSGIIIFGLYCLIFGLAGMHYAGKLRLMATPAGRADYVTFSIFVLAVTAIGVFFYSFLRPQ
jgi:hypothetical protein